MEAATPELAARLLAASASLELCGGAAVQALQTLRTEVRHPPRFGSAVHQPPPPCAGSRRAAAPAPLLSAARRPIRNLQKLAGRLRREEGAPTLQLHLSLPPPGHP